VWVLRLSWTENDLFGVGKMHVGQFFEHLGVVGFGASGVVVMRRKMRRETLIALADKLPRAFS
jgi:hypothetical protein